jgi:hypothetical protein
MLQFLLYAFIAYILYNLIFRFIIPVYRTTRQIKRGFRDMQEKMNSQMGGQGPFGPSEPQQPTEPQPKKGDYIDFEEVK